MKIARMLLGVVVGFLILGISMKAFAFVVNALGSLMLYGFTESDRAFADLEAAANILGFLGGLYVAYRCYRWISPAGTPAVPSAN